MRWLIIALLFLLILLQYRLWIGDGSLSEVYGLQKEIADQKKDLDDLKERNRILRAEVEDLKRGMDAIEERARTELGMIKKGEIFFQVIEAEETSGK